MSDQGLEQRNLQAVSSKWQQAIELAKPTTTNHNTNTLALPPGNKVIP